MFSLFKRRPSIPDALWAQVRSDLHLLEVPAAREAAWRSLCEEFLARHRFETIGDLELDDRMALLIAAQACVPVLEFGLSIYSAWPNIVIYPEGFVAQRVWHDEMGVVHESTEELAGEAWDRGQIVLSWSDASTQGWGSNVVIHEFAHALDLANGAADGFPSGLPAALRGQWASVAQASFSHFCAVVEHVEAAIPAHIDPESAAAQAWWQELPLDPYAASDPAEFFAVSIESFFVEPLTLYRHYPAWYRLLAAYLKQDWLSERGLAPPAHQSL